MFREILNVSWLICNSDFHGDLNIETMLDIMKRMAQKHEWWFNNYPYTEAIELLEYMKATR